MRKSRRTSAGLVFAKRLLSVALFILFIGALVFGIRTFLTTAAYFQIKKVTFVGLDDRQAVEEISHEFLYDNIFVIDINAIKDQLHIAHPQFYDVEVVRRFPDELFIKIVQRKPRVQLKHNGFYLIDSEGVIVSEVSKEPFKGYSAVCGLRKIGNLSFGKKIHLQELAASLRLLDALQELGQETRMLLAKKVKAGSDIAIDVSQYPSLSVLYGDLELRFYEDYIEKELRQLQEVAPSLRERIAKVSYIDLRFEDPVISFKK